MARSRLRDIEKQKKSIEQEQENIIQEKKMHEEFLIKMKEAYIQKKLAEQQQKIRHDKFIKKYNQAVKFHENILLRDYFRKFRNILKIRDSNIRTADACSETRVMRTAFRIWVRVYRENSKLRIQAAQNCYKLNLLKRCWKTWSEVSMEGKNLYWMTERLASVGIIGDPLNGPS